MDLLFSLGMWGAGFIGFGLMFLIFALVFSEKMSTALARAALTLCGVFGLACILGGLALLGRAPAMGPPLSGFEALAAYALAFAIGLALAVFALAIFAGGSPHHGPILSDHKSW